MHEMGIASSILEAVDVETRLYPGQWPAKVGVVIGEYAGVDTESLRFCFEVLTKDQKPLPLELDISWRPGSDELKLSYLEMEEVRGDQGDEQDSNREEGLKRERSNCGAAA
jgi:Zn finger protein HypA/HybF involved in hydrogenase expression